MRRGMLPVIQIVLLAVLGVALLLVVIGAILPRNWRVERSIMINAPARAVHDAVSDLEHWSEWAQWDRAALSPRNELGEPRSGAGATLRWHGQGRSGETTGEVRIVESDPARGVWFEHRLSGAEPSRAALLYAPKPGVTEVTWRDEGELPPIVGGLFLDYFQTRLAEHMNEGLARLKQLVEHGTPATP
jgi:uncharacterized membrane protein